jgi:hypothetical protein
MGRRKMEVATLASNYLSRFKSRYGANTSQNQWSALNAILGCRTKQYGQIYLSCKGCAGLASRYQSCGHRACNQCQNHCATQWLARQESKLLPVEYFMVTFTLPFELRELAKQNQKVMYSLLFQCATSTIKEFGLNNKDLSAEPAMTAILHTHTRKLDYHPHVHLIVPGGGINKKRNEWRKLKSKYLFNGFALAAVFRGKMLAAIKHAHLKLTTTPKKWVVQCVHVGRGLPALKYLSRYLYKGVISNKNILSDDGDFVTFQYKESSSGLMKNRRLRGEEFLALLLQHTLPKGFRRARDFGFLHGNAKRTLKLVQLLLRVFVPIQQKIERQKFVCKHCLCAMTIIGFSRPSPALE